MRETRKYLETYENENNIRKYMKCNKAMLRWEFILTNIYIKKDQSTT